MHLKLLKFSMMTSLTLSLLVLSEGVGYSYSYQTDNRGFPAQQSSGSAFSSTFNSPSTVSSPIFNNAPAMQNSNMQQSNTKQHQHNQNGHKHHYQRYYNNVTPYYFYYNTGVQPYYVYPGEDSYYYSTPPSNGYNSNNTDNTQTSLPTYDSSSLPDGTWVSESGGAAPDKAFVYQISNGAPSYYCRVQYNYTTYYGVLTPNVGCYIQDQSAIIQFNQYEVLISPN